MAEARAFSPNFISVQAVADAALLRPEGVTLRYTVAEWGNLANAKTRARSFQKSYCSLRDRARALSRRQLGETASAPPRASMARGPYDNLSCFMETMDNDEGFKVVLMNGHNLLGHMDIIDNATGLPLSEIGKAQTDVSRLQEQFVAAYFENTGASFSLDQCLELIALDDDAKDDVQAYMKGWRMSAAGMKAGRPIAPPIGEFADKSGVTDIIELGDAAFEGWEGADEGSEQTP